MSWRDEKEYSQEELKRMSNPELIKLLSEKVSKTLHMDTRWYATKELGKRNYPGAVETLIRVLLHDDYHHARVAAVEALSWFENETTIEALKKAVGDTYSDVSRKAVNLLKSFIGETNTTKILINGLKDDNIDIRYNSIRFLINMKYPHLFEVAINALEDNYAGVCILATEVLEKMGNIKAVEPLLATLKRKYEYDKWAKPYELIEAVEKALISIGDANVIPQLVEQYALNLKDSISSSIIIELGKKNIKLLLQSFERYDLYNNKERQESVVYILKSIRNREALSTLKNMAKGDFGNEIAKYAKDALDRNSNK